MLLPKYTDYKDSDVSWLDLIPEHWEVKKFRFLFSLGRGLGITKANLLNDGVPCVNYGEIHSKYGFEVIPEKHPLKCVSPDYLETGTSALLSSGDFVFADTSEDLEGSGNFSYLNSNAATFAGYHTVIARLVSNDSPRYIAYLFDSLQYRYQVRKSVSGVKVFSITQEILKNGYVWLPPSDEQAKITQFLDYKTTRIDRLIEKKKALIEKLNEQRISVITRAVTKGLNSDTPMKDSEAEWLGKVPNHWEITKLRYCTSLVTSGSRGWAKYFSDIGKVFLRITNLTRQSIKLDSPDLLRVSLPPGTEGERTQTQSGDILISITADLGSVAVIPKQYETAYVSQHISLVRPELDKIIPEWLAYSVFSHMGKAQLLGAGYGGTKQQLSLGDIKELILLRPPDIHEQKSIVDWLEIELQKLDRMVAVNQQTIEKLEEYRTTLITAAVTGKIDVRNVEIPAQVTV